MQSKSNIFLWCLYDFANSIVFIVFFLYFTQWVVIEKGVADIWLNVSFSSSALLLLFTVPFTGIWLDSFLRRIDGLRFSTICTTFFFLLCAILVIDHREIYSLIAFALASYFYLLSFTFYTPLLNDIASPEKRGRVSGYGIASNYLGQFTGLALALPFSQGSINLFNASPRVETLIPSVIVFLLLSLPIIIFFKEDKRPMIKIDFNHQTRELIQKTKELFLYPGILYFMLSYFFFNDAILTASNNFPIFMEQVWGVSDTIKTYILFGILITSAIGGIISGLIADKWGNKKTLLFILFGWVIILPVMGLTTNFIFFCFMAVLMGFWFGANWTVSRSLMSFLAPVEKNNLAFAYFGLTERISSFVGPIVWGLIVSNMLSIGADRYRLAVVAISLFIILGLYFLLKVRDDKQNGLF